MVVNDFMDTFLLPVNKNVDCFHTTDAGSIPENLPTISSTCTPMVGLLIQGGPLDIDHVVDLLRRKVPVLVVQGSGLGADLISFVYFEKINQ